MFKLICASAALVATAAIAQAPNSDDGTTTEKDPNEVICISQNTTGSRVNRVRVCRTRAEWAQTKAETRQKVDQIQSMKPTTDN